MQEDDQATLPGDQETRGHTPDLHLFLVELRKAVAGALATAAGLMLYAGLRRALTPGGGSVHFSELC